ncbi:MAG: endonuclease domain-containing protein [Actinomycetota bacterium]
MTRTLIDLAAVCPMEVVEEALDDALRRRLVTIPQLRRRLAELPRGRPGITPMRALLDAREQPVVPQSVFETRLLRLMRRAGLPQPVLQHEIYDGQRRIGFVDFAFVDQRLVIEADGYRWHFARERFENDHARRNDLTLLGWRVLAVTWKDLCRRPDWVANSIRRALTGAGSLPGQRS